jgi:hypothetical protein
LILQAIRAKAKGRQPCGSLGRRFRGGRRSRLAPAATGTGVPVVRGTRPARSTDHIRKKRPARLVTQIQLVLLLQLFRVHIQQVLLINGIALKMV